MQVIGCTSISSDLQLDFALCISWFLHRNHTQMRQLIITMVDFLL